MDTIVEALGDQFAELDALVAPLEGEAWSAPSRCEGWTVADVLLHLAQTDELALASVEGRFEEQTSELAGGADGSGTVDDGAALLVERERDTPPDAVRARWRRSADDLLRAFDACPPGQRVTWVAGQLSARTLTTTRLAETWIHTGDIAHGLGVAVEPTDRLRHIARLAWRTLPYAFARAGRELAGPVAFSLRGPSGETWDLVPDEAPLTTVRGDALDLCLVAARRVEAADTSLRADGPDAAGVLELVRTYA